MAYREFLGSCLLASVLGCTGGVGEGTAGVATSSTSSDAAGPGRNTDAGHAGTGGTAGADAKATDGAVAETGAGDAATAADAAPVADAAGGERDATADARAPTAPPGSVPMFVAQGHVGRTIVSCDDGLTWVGNRSLETEGDPYVCGSTAAVTCFTDGLGCSFWRDGQCQPAGASCDCDHHPGAGTGIAYGDGWFVATWGWGPPGSVRRSRNGIDWEVVLSDTSFGGIAYGQDTFILGNRQPRVSDDHGESWRDGAPADLSAPGGGDDTIYNVRALGFADVMGGRFVLAGEDGDKRDVLISSDAGASWWRPSTLPSECAAGTRAIVGGGGVIAIIHRTGNVCYSTDGGETFSLSNTGGAIESGAVWTGQRFMAWGRGQAYHSPDAATWTETATTLADFLPGAVAHNPVSGTLAAIRGGWQTWYDEQRFYRSLDGIEWTTLDAGDISSTPAQNHPVGHMTFGYASPSSQCPEPMF